MKWHKTILTLRKRRKTMANIKFTLEKYKGADGTYGIRDSETGAILLPPTYEWIGELYRRSTWIKRKEGFGLLDCDTLQEIIPCEYGFPLYPNLNNQIIVWKNQKAGLINLNNQILIPIEYDTIELINHRYYLGEKEERFYWFDLEANPIPETKEMAEYTHPDKSDEQEEELYQLPMPQLEQRIKEACSNYWHSQKEEDYDKTITLIQIRQQRMNEQWKHNAANAARIDRVNTLLNNTVREALQLGQRTAASLSWMNDLPNESYSVNVGVYPYWANDKSEVGYQPKLTGEEEEQRLCDQEYNEGYNHIWNIIREIGSYRKYGSKHPMCFTASSDSADPSSWDFEEATMDDGQSWDEGIHRPIYQNIHFLHPWHRLYWDDFYYALEDLARMNDFRIEIKVNFEKIGTR